MHTDQEPSPERQSAFRDRVRSWAVLAGVEPPFVDVADDVEGCATVRTTSGFALMISPALITAPAEIQDRILAHEFGHILLDDVPDQRAARAGAFAGGVAIVIGGLGALAVVLFNRYVLFTVAAAFSALALVVMSASRRPLRHAELAADRVAAERLNKPFDSELAAWLKSTGNPGPGRPSHHRRIREARKHTRSTSDN